MKQPKQLRLKQKGKKNSSIHFKLSTDDKEKYIRALEKLNAFSPVINFSMSEFVAMATKDFADRIVGEKLRVVLDIPNRKISFFELEPTKRKVAQ